MTGLLLSAVFGVFIFVLRMVERRADDAAYSTTERVASLKDSAFSLSRPQSEGKR